MRHTIIAFCAIAVFALQVRAQSAPATQPAPPSTSQSLPQPVLILPFVTPSDAKYKDSGRAIQQDLASAVASDLRGRVSASAETAPAASPDAALAAARKSNAAAVVFGQMQVNEGQVRLSGQVLDTASGQSLGSLRESGSIENLFELEDALAPQVVAALPESLLNLRGLLSARPGVRPQRIYLPGDEPTMQAPQGPIDGGYAGPIAPYALPAAPGGSPPYSPMAGSYPYRFVAPYASLFSYDYDPDPFLPLYGEFYPERFGRMPAHSRPWHDGVRENARHR